MPKPLRRHRWLCRKLAVLASCFAGLLLLVPCGCTSIGQWVQNGFKVGPNYGKPPAAVADDWIDAKKDPKNPKLRRGEPDLAAWYCVFNDPVLNDLIQQAYAQNLTVRAAGFRVLQARAQLGIAIGEILPQTQTANAVYSRNEVSLTRSGTVNVGSSGAGPKRFFDNYAVGLGMAWELDFWGKFRRAVESADAVLDSSIEDYDDALVILLSDVAATYVELRTLQKRLDLAEKNVKEQIPMVAQMESRLKAKQDPPSQYKLLKANLDNTQALVPPLESALRQANNKLCVLLGMPPRDLLAGEKAALAGRIPKAPEQVVLDIPGNLLLRRPDVLRAERLVAAQSAQIGIAEAEFYPHISINGNIGLQSAKLATLFNSLSWVGNIGPSLSWNILNYGRILNSVRFQDAKFQELATLYQNVVLNANEEAEDALIAYLKALDRAKHLKNSADAAADATANLLLRKDLPKDTGPFITQLFTTQNFKVQQQDAAAQAEGDIALNLVRLYRALGGGWQIRLGAGCPEEVAPPPRAVPPVQEDKKDPPAKEQDAGDEPPLRDQNPTLLPALTPAPAADESRTRRPSVTARPLP